MLYLSNSTNVSQKCTYLNDLKLFTILPLAIDMCIPVSSATFILTSLFLFSLGKFGNWNVVQ